MLPLSPSVSSELFLSIKRYRAYARQLSELGLTPLQAAVLIAIMDDAGSIESDWIYKQEWATYRSLERAMRTLECRLIYSSYSAGSHTYHLSPLGIAAAKAAKDMLGGQTVTRAAKEIILKSRMILDDDW